MKIKIHVTQDILERTQFCRIGTKSTSKNCAVAHAVRDIFPRAQVEYDYIHPYGHKEFGVDLSSRSDDPHKIKLPEEAIEFIRDFDSLSSKARVNMPPLSFEVDVPKSVINKIGITQVEEILSKSLTLEKVF